MLSKTKQMQELNVQMMQENNTLPETLPSIQQWGPPPLQSSHTEEIEGEKKKDNDFSSFLLKSTYCTEKLFLMTIGQTANKTLCLNVKHSSNCLYPKISPRLYLRCSNIYKIISFLLKQSLFFDSIV